MDKVAENNDTSVKLSKNALKQLESKARPFESKKDCLERIITQNCGAASDAVKSTEPEEIAEAEKN